MRIREDELNVFNIVDSPKEALRELKSLDDEIQRTKSEWHDDVDENEKPFVL
jgi:mRNA-degrading endonuclease RelE of RelBE toxin-antitoxin system